MSIEIFNFQIRKIGDFSSVYKDIDKSLDKHGIIKGGTGKKIKQQAVAHSLHKMMRKSGHFSICNITESAEAAGIHISSERKAIYSTAHCVSWGDMTSDYKEMLIAMVMDDFRELFLSTDSKDVAI